MGKRQHYNPVLHLRNFTDPNGFVWTYDKSNGAVLGARPENTAVEGHYYTIDKDDGTVDMSVEDLLTSVEDVSAPVYRALLDGRIPSGQEKMDFSHFLAVQYYRTPTMRRNAANIFARTLQLDLYAHATNDRIFESFVRRFSRDTGRTFTDEEKQELRDGMLDPSRFTMEIGKHVAIRPLVKGSEELANIFYDMNWALFRPVHGYFLTSDNPVIRRVQRRSVSRVYGDGGFLNKSVEVTYPLSPKLVIGLFWHETHPLVVDCPKEFVSDVNAGRCAQAERYVYAGIDDQRVRRLAATYRTHRVEMQMRGFGPKRYAPVEVRRRSRVGPEKGNPKKPDTPSASIGP